MAYTTIKSANHKNWLASRTGGIGSSEVATLLGVNPWQTPYQLWLAKTGRVPQVEQENFLMKAGHYLEDAISKFCADETGLDIIKSSAAEFVVINKEKPFLRVSPDRYAWLPNSKHSNDNKVIIECKSTQNSIDENDIPKHWFVQVMYQLGVCELDKATIAWLTQGREFGYKWLEFDKEFFNDVIVAEVERFWIDNILGGKEPALMDIQDVLTKYPRHREGLCVDATDELIETYNELKETNAEIKRLTALKSAAEEKIKLAMGEAEMIVIPATNDNPQKTLASWRASKESEKFDADLFKTENPEMYAKYLHTVQGSRRFMLR